MAESRPATPGTTGTPGPPWETPGETPGTPPSRRSLASRLLQIGVWALVALLLLVAGLVFVASRTVTLQWVAQKAVLFTDGKLDIQGISGSVLSEISAESVHWHDDSIDVTVTSPRFVYHPFALLDGLVRIERVSAANIEVELPAAPASSEPGEPVRLPQAMAALLPVAIERVDIGRVVVRRAGSEEVKLHNLEVVFRHDGDRFNASLLNVDVIAGGNRIGVRGEAAVLARAPYATDGRFALQLPWRPQPLRVDVRVNGPLEELSVRASTQIAGAPVDARTVLFALDPRPLRQVRLDVKDFDLSRYDPTLPATRLTATLDAEVMPAWASERKPLLIGPLNLTNTLAGPLDRRRIPLAAAKAVVSYVEGRVEVQGLQADGPLGEVTGDGWAGPGSFRVVLASDKLRLQGINSTLAPRILKAQLAVEPIKTPAKAPTGGTPFDSTGGLRLELKASDAALAADMKAVFANNTLQVSRAQVQIKSGRKGGAGQASFSGTVGAAAPWPIDLSGHFRDFDPAQLVAMPAARFNGEWRVAGRVGAGDGSDGGEFKTSIKLADSRFRELPLAGALSATLSLRNNQPHRLSAVDAGLTWGSSTIEASGALGEATDTLRLVVDLPKIAEVQGGITGAVSVQGSLRGALLAPAVEASIDGRRLAATTAGGLRASIATAALQLKSARMQSGVLNLQVRLAGVELARSTELVSFNRVTAIVDGSYAEHTADLEATGKGQRIKLAAEGGIADDGVWRGSVNELAASHPLLKMPAVTAGANGAGDDVESLQTFALTAGADRVNVRDARFGIQGATLNLKQVDWHDSILNLKADATAITARWLGRFVDLDALYGPRNGRQAIPTDRSAAGSGTRVMATAPQDLRLGAAIDFTGDLADTSAAGWRGTMLLKRELGDISLVNSNSDASIRAGLRTLEASASIAARVVKVVLNVDGENIGRISGEAQTSLQGGGAPVWARSSLSHSPLGGRLDLAMSSFRWISPLVGDSWLIDGALSARLQLAGTLTKPRADGIVTGNNLSAQEQASGMRLRNGVLAAELAGDRIDVKVLRFESGEGSVAISGLLQAPGAGRSEARIVIDRLPIPLGVGQRVVLSGSTTATLEARTLNVSGRLVADEGVIELKGGDAPAVSSDVVIVDAKGQEHAVKNALPAPGVDAADKPAIRKMGARAAGAKAAGGDKPAQNPQAFGITSDIEIDLGRHFRVFGSGLEANLHGAIRLHGTLPEAPRATGTVEIVNGTYQVYGRKLRIKRGRIIFNGPLDNPSLDIVAIREHLKIEPGVEISGTAVSPVVKLISDPEVADAEKLSWLVLGTGLEDAQGAGQLLALQAAATTMFGDEDSKYAPGLTEKLGIDVLSVREQANSATTTAGSTSDNAQGAVVTVGKRLSSRLFVTYEQSLRGVWNILKLQYEITDRLSLSVQAGSDSAVDLLWFFPFD